MAVLVDPSASGRMVFGDGPSADDLVMPLGIEAKLGEISRKIDARLETAREKALKRRDSETAPGGALADLRAWADDEIPENVVHRCELLYYANDRTVSALIAHLVEHVAIGEELRSIAHAARRRSADELRFMPAGMVELVARLTASGVVNADVRKMSRERLSSVVSAIKGITSEDADQAVRDVPMDALPLPDSSATDAVGGGVVGPVDGTGDAFSPRVDDSGPDGVGDGVDTGSQDGGSQDSEGGSDAPAATGSDGLEGEDPVGRDEDVDDGSDTVPAVAAEPVPVGPPVTRWGVLDLSRIGYVAEEVLASSDQDMRALKMPLPEVDTLVELAAKGTPEYMSADGAQDNHDRVLVGKFFPSWMKRTGTRLTEAEQRVWALLLVEMKALGRGRNMGANGWFDGLVLPKGDGSARVIRIHAVDRSDEGLRDALRP